MGCLPLLLLLGSLDTTFIEPTTGVAFNRAYTDDGRWLVLTGANRRRVMGKDAYAVAHYAEVDTAREALGLGPEERRDFFVGAPGQKVIVFHGIHGKVPARAIRWSWNKHFRSLEREPHEGFVDAFRTPFRRGERLYFVASTDGVLSVYHDGNHLGTWEDPQLTQDIWRMCLGPETEVEAPDNLVVADVPEDAQLEIMEFPLPRGHD